MNIKKDSNPKKSRDTIKLKMERLKAYCKKYPYAFSNFASLKEKLIEEGKQKEIEELEKLYEFDYKYVRSRKEKGKIDEKVEQELKESKIGGVFGFAEEDALIKEKYKIKDKKIIQILQEFGTIDRFREAYIKDIKDGTKSENVLKYSTDLPLVKYFDLAGKKNYNLLLKSIFGEIDDIIIGKDVDVKMDSLIEDTLSDKEQNVLQLLYGLKDGKKRSLRKVGKEYNVTGEYIRKIQEKAFRKLRVKYKEPELFEKCDIFIPTEEFIEEYFKVHDIFTDGDGTNLSEGEVEKLTQICNDEMSQRVQKVNSEKQNVTQKIEELIEQLDDIINKKGTQDIETTMLQATKILHEQREILKELNEPNKENQKEINKTDKEPTVTDRELE